jgi:hypothetical protein
MAIIGWDFHPSWQAIAAVDEQTGEIVERKLKHSDGEAETRPARGDWVFARKIMVAVGPNRWLVRWPNSLHRN